MSSPRRSSSRKQTVENSKKLAVKIQERDIKLQQRTSSKLEKLRNKEAKKYTEEALNFSNTVDAIEDLETSFIEEANTLPEDLDFHWDHSGDIDSPEKLETEVTFNGDLFINRRRSLSTECNRIECNCPDRSISPERCSRAVQLFDETIEEEDNEDIFEEAMVDESGLNQNDENSESINKQQQSPTDLAAIGENNSNPINSSQAIPQIAMEESVFKEKLKSAKLQERQFQSLVATCAVATTKASVSRVTSGTTSIKRACA